MSSVFTHSKPKQRRSVRSVAGGWGLASGRFDTRGTQTEAHRWRFVFQSSRERGERREREEREERTLLQLTHLFHPFKSLRWRTCLTRRKIGIRALTIKFHLHTFLFAIRWTDLPNVDISLLRCWTWCILPFIPSFATCPVK